MTDAGTDAPGPQGQADPAVTSPPAGSFQVVGLEDPPGPETAPDTAAPAVITESAPEPAPATRAERRAARVEAQGDAAAAPDAPRSGFRRTVDLTGRILIGAGIILLLFTAYQIWGTSLQESHAQSQLRKQFESEGTKRSVAHALTAASQGAALPTGPPVTAPHLVAPAEGSPVGDIRIPAIGLNQVVVEGTNTDDLRQGPGHYVGTPLPGQTGNAAIAGHRTTYGHPFYNLDAVKTGDPIVVTTLQGVFVYDAIKQEVVSPSDTSVVDNVDADWLTLTTCNPRFSASTRLVVVAELAHSHLFGTTDLPKAAAPRHPQSENLAGNTNVELTDAVIWGFFVVLVGGVILYLGHRFRRYRWPVWVVGTLGVLVLLYAFFGAVSPLLPASF
jgi:sortase A